MKQLILTVASIAIFLSATMSHAAPLKLPSRSQLIKLIKQADRADLGVAGLRSHKNCEKVSINSVKILKVGRATSGYYKESGNYAGSSFMVKLKATGTCSFDSFHHTFYIHAGEDLDGDGREDRISGTLPIINEPLEIGISTDSYGDWKAGNLRFAGKDLESARIKEHIKKLYIKAKAEMGKRYSYITIINSVKPGKGNGIYYGAFAVANKKTSRYSLSTDVQRTFGTGYRLAGWYDLINYYEKNGSVLELFKRLGINPKKGAILNGGYVVHCSIFHPDSAQNSGRPDNLLLYKSKFKAEPLCLTSAYTNSVTAKSTKFLAVKVSEYGERASLKQAKRSTRTSKRSNTPSPAPTPFNTNKNSSQPATADEKRVDEIRLWFKQRPKASKVYYQQSKDVRYRLFKRIYERKTKQERRRAFLNIANSLENGGKQRSTSGSNSHSHGGRVHAHKLPHQGKAHRHNNGAIGR